MASGIKRLRFYWKELLILTLLALHNLFASFLQAIDLPLLTAKFGAFSLWLTGFNAYREGVIIALPTGKVEVYGACSGVESILLMVFIACLFLLLFPLSRLQQVVCLFLAACLGFAVNGVRVALMAILVAYSNQEAFKYWHGDDGSLIFAMIAVALFGLFCWFAYVRNFNSTSHSGDF
jgi:cyanoexosortase A